MGNESQHTLHTNEIDKVFQNGILRYIGLMIGLMYIQPSKQSEMEEVFQKWNIPVYWLDDWLDVYPTAIRGISCHKTSKS
jgi:hypothetical protein